MSASSQSKSRREQGGGISLFPFLAVLICTMGALLVLLVVLSHQANERRRLAALAQANRLEDAPVGETSAKDAEAIGSPTALDAEFFTLETIRRKNLQLREQYAASRQRLTQLETQLAQLREQTTRNEAALDPSNDSATTNASQLSSADIETLQAQLEQRRAGLETARSAAQQTLQTHQQTTEQRQQQILETETERQQLLTQIEQQKSQLTQTQTQLTAILTEKQATETRLAQSGKRGALSGVENIAASAETITEGKPVYSIVPYAGGNGVRRRPIYLECRRDGIFLQPEGIRFDVSDFADLGTKQQPLTIALELAAAAIHPSQPLQTTGNTPAVERSYVLLLVRPNGIAAYYAARAALENREGEYGYEMIGQDWEMAYPEANPKLRQEIVLAVGAARAELRKRQMLAVLAASNTPTSLADTSLLLSPNRTTHPVQGSGGLGVGNELASGAETGLTGGTGNGLASGVGNGVGVDTQNSMTTETAAKTPNTAPVDGGFDRLVFGPPTQNNVSEAGDLANDDHWATSNEEDAVEFGGAHGTSTGGSGSRTATHSGAGSGTGSNSSSAADGTSAASSGSSHASSLASTRGKNWGLPDAVPTMSPVSRPIHAVCTIDRVTLQRNPQTRKTPEIMLTDSTSRAMDDLVSAVWDHMKTWGFAGRQMYWKPVLNVEVSSGAETRFQEIETLLAGSGIEVHRVEVSKLTRSSGASSSASSSNQTTNPTTLTR